MPNLAPLASYGAMAWADIDADGDFDLFVTGYLKTKDFTRADAGLYLNEGDYILPGQGGQEGDQPATNYVSIGAIESQLSNFGLWRGSVAWGDFNNDGRPDLATSGKPSPGGSPVTRFYRLSAAPATVPDLVPVQWLGDGTTEGELAWGDYDNDGDLDLVVTGMGSFQGITRLYENRISSEGRFVEHNPAFWNNLQLWHSRVAWGDYDNDMDLDLLMTGLSSRLGSPTTVLLANQGNGEFVVRETGLPGYVHGTIAWGDGDGDGDLDILMTGGELGPFLVEGRIHVFENDGGSFSDTGVSILGRYDESGTGRYSGDAEWGDFNNDGLLDFFVAGYESPTSTRGAQTYESEGDMRFVYSTIGFSFGVFTGGTNGTVAWGDYDGDYDLDILSYGMAPGGNVSALTYQNHLPEYPRNNAPTAPSSLDALVSGSDVRFSWNAASDSATPTTALTYNIRVGTSPGGHEVMSAMATESGRRLVSAMGNAGHNLGWRLKNLPQGTYYWTVQAIDTSYIGSPFAAEQTFSINP